MRAIELFKELKAENIVEELIKDPDFFDIINIDNTIDNNEKNRRKEIIKSKYINEIKKIQNKNIQSNSSDFLLVTMGYDEEFYEIHLLRMEEIEKIKKNIEIKDCSEFSNPLYAIEFSDRNEILGHNISKSTLNKYGKNLIASIILREITFFGIDEEQCETTQSQNLKELLEITKNIENGLEKTISEEELFKELELEDDRTDEEKEMQSKKIHEKTERYIRNVINEIKDTLILENIIEKA